MSETVKRTNCPMCHSRRKITVGGGRTMCVHCDMPCEKKNCVQCATGHEWDGKGPKK